MADASLQAVVEALNVLYTNPDREAKEKANAWLGEFQKSVRITYRSVVLLATLWTVGNRRADGPSIETDEGSGRTTKAGTSRTASGVLMAGCDWPHADAVPWLWCCSPAAVGPLSRRRRTPSTPQKACTNTLT